MQYIFKTETYPYGILTKETTNSNYEKAWMVGIFFILFFGLREPENDPHRYLGDTIVYTNYYNLVKSGIISAFEMMRDENGQLDLNTEFLFIWLRDGMIVLGTSVNSWYTVVACVFMIPKLLLIKRWFPNNTYLAILFIITSFGFYAGGINGIRNADASSLAILGISYIIAQRKNKKNYFIGILLCIAGYYTHHAVIITILALVASFFVVRDIKMAIAIWGVSILMSLIMGNTLANYGATLFDDERVMRYLEAGDNGEIMRLFSNTGFRWDFLLYSAMPLLMGWYVMIKKNIIDTTYKLLVNTYILANAVWIIFIYASFSNRFAALSWSLYSYVLLYPLVRYNIWGNKQSYYTTLILIGQMIFSIVFLN